MRYGLPGHIGIGFTQKRATALLLAVVLLFAVLLAGFHHHDDEQDHPDCSICAVAHHHSADTALHPPPALRLPTVFPTTSTPATQKAMAARIIHSPRNRAPPA